MSQAYIADCIIAARTAVELFVCSDPRPTRPVLYVCKHERTAKLFVKEVVEVLTKYDEPFHRPTRFEVQLNNGGGIRAVSAVVRIDVPWGLSASQVIVDDMLAAYEREIRNAIRVGGER